MQHEARDLVMKCLLAPGAADGHNLLAVEELLRETFSALTTLPLLSPAMDPVMSQNVLISKASRAALSEGGFAAEVDLVQLLDARRVDHDLTGCTLPTGSRLLKENRTAQNTQQFVTEQMHASTIHLIVKGICSHLQR